jgi:hypothetical protein
VPAAGARRLDSSLLTTKPPRFDQCERMLARPKRFELLTPSFVVWTEPLSQNDIFCKPRPFRAMKHQWVSRILQTINACF